MPAGQGRMSRPSTSRLPVLARLTVALEDVAGGERQRLAGGRLRASRFRRRGDHGFGVRDRDTDDVEEVALRRIRELHLMVGALERLGVLLYLAELVEPVCVDAVDALQLHREELLVLRTPYLLDD